MTAAECAEEYIRIVAERTEPALRHSEWDQQSVWVRETITKLAQQVIEAERQSTVKKIVEIIEDVDIHTRAEILEEIRKLELFTV